jgi:histone-lysine N-methyltransferase SETMAR
VSQWNARPHTARQTQTLLHDAFHWDTFDRPPYSPDLAPSDFYLFPKMEHLAGKRFTDDEDLQYAVMDWLNSLARAGNK